MSARAARRRAEREARKAKQKADSLVNQMSLVHTAIARSEHPKRAKLLGLSREMLAVWHGIEDLGHGVEGLKQEDLEEGIEHV